MALASKAGIIFSLFAVQFLTIRFAGHSFAKAILDSAPKQKIQLRLHVSALLFPVGVLIRPANIIRQQSRYHCRDCVLTAVLYRLCVIPALEFQHIQRAVHALELRFHVRLLRLKQRFALGIC